MIDFWRTITSDDWSLLLIVIGVLVVGLLLGAAMERWGK